GGATFMEDYEGLVQVIASTYFALAFQRQISAEDGRVFDRNLHLLVNRKREKTSRLGNHTGEPIIRHVVVRHLQQPDVPACARQRIDCGARPSMLSLYQRPNVDNRDLTDIEPTG